MCIQYKEVYFVVVLSHDGTAPWRIISSHNYIFPSYIPIRPQPKQHKSRSCHGSFGSCQLGIFWHHLIEHDFVPLRNVEPCHHAEPWGERLQIRPEGCAQTVAHVQRQSQTPRHWCSGMRCAIGGVGLGAFLPHTLSTLYIESIENCATRGSSGSFGVQISDPPSTRIRLEAFRRNYSSTSPRAEAKILREEDSWMAKVPGMCSKCGKSCGENLLLTSWMTLWSCHKFHELPGLSLLIFHRWHWPNGSE